MPDINQGKNVIKYKATNTYEGKPNYGGGNLDISVSDGVVDTIHDEDAFTDGLIRAVISKRDKNGFGCSVSQLRGVKDFWVGQLSVPLLFSYSVYFLEHYVFNSTINVGHFDFWQSRNGEIHIEVGLSPSDANKIVV